MILNLEKIFVTEGVPEYTFVKPPNYVDILLDVRKAGKPVIIEGQSGTGKTTAIKHIIKEVGLEAAAVLSARKPVDVEKIEKVALDRPSGVFVIDDFHRLSTNLREQTRRYC
jgi:DNA transposition AAA+ family ATPase